MDAAYFETRVSKVALFESLGRGILKYQEMLMIYELRTYTLIAGAEEEFTKRIAERQPARERYSPMAAYWRVDVGPLNEVVHVWPYSDAMHREKVRASLGMDEDLRRLPPRRDLVLTQRSELMTPTSFMRPMGSKDFGSGNIYVMRIDTYAPGALPDVLTAWSAALPAREVLSPLVACWTNDVGDLNRLVHVWVYKDHAQRSNVLAEVRERGVWPPKTSSRPMKQESKVLLPAAFSPLR